MRTKSTGLIPKSGRSLEHGWRRVERNSDTQTSGRNLVRNWRSFWPGTSRCEHKISFAEQEKEASFWRIVRWCNGSTRPFGGLCPGSNPGRTATFLKSMPRVIFHLDMDAFYASIEQRDNPSLRGKPVIVGSPPTQRGVVCAASYVARKFGVRSAMPSVTAGRLCPKGIFVRPRMNAYRDESVEIMEIVSQTGAAIEQMSIDEAYLDLTDVMGKRVSARAEGDEWLEASLPIGRELKRRIASERGLTASIGIAANKLLAKIASDF